MYHLVVVNFKTPYVVDGLNNNYFSGVGLIISVKKGLVIVDRNTVLVALGDCDVVLGSSLILPGLPVALVIPSIDAFLNNTQPEYITLDVELWPAPLATARDMGLDDEWCKQLEQREHQLLVVRRIVAKSDAQKKLIAGDLILTINGTLINRFIDRQFG